MIANQIEARFSRSVFMGRRNVLPLSLALTLPRKASFMRSALSRSFQVLRHPKKKAPSNKVAKKATAINAACMGALFAAPMAVTGMESESKPPLKTQARTLSLKPISMTTLCPSTQSHKRACSVIYPRHVAHCRSALLPQASSRAPKSANFPP